jgi:penicillin G amidase
MLNRFVRIVNVTGALAAVLIAIAVYWVAYRPLPQTKGELEAPVRADGVIRRDARGIPHIEAASWQDAVFLQGFATAQDRLWQMDSLRRFAAGELAEVFGPGAVAVDARARRMRMRAMADANVARLRKEDRELLIEYARGVNYYIDTHRGNYSLEFSLPGHAYDPRYWTLTDSMLIGLIMFRDLTDNSEYEFFKGSVLRQADPGKANVLLPSPEGQELSPGSNAWAVAGTHTHSGRAMLANDMHLSYGIPGTWHLVHLKSPELEVAGTALPGVPLVITGHNRQVAWGVTNLGADVMDLYAEQMDLRTGRYLYAGKTEQAQLDHQVIAVRGSKPEVVDIWVTRHGPVVSSDGNVALSMRWSAADGFGFPFFDIARSSNWDEFRRAVSIFWGPAQNFVYADASGNIGYQAAGRLPIRGDGKTPYDTDAPLNGATGQVEWTGYVPFEQMPSVYNPPSGVIASANQNPFPSAYPFPVRGRFDDGYRVRQIRNRLTAKQELTIDDMAAIQKDVYSEYDVFLAQQVLRLPGNDGRLREVKEVLARDLKEHRGQMDQSLASPVITQLLSNTARTALLTGLNPALKPAFLPRSRVLQKLLETRPKGWVPQDNWDAWLLAQLNKALDEGRQKQGSPIRKWKWGELLQWHFEHPVGKQLPLVSGFFNLGPVPMSGSGTTVKQTTRTLGPSERLVVDFGDLDGSTLEIPVGESGMVASSHYKDQWPAYYVGKSFPMAWSKVTGADTLRIRPDGSLQDRALRTNSAAPSSSPSASHAPAQ